VRAEADSSRQTHGQTPAILRDTDEVLSWLDFDQSDMETVMNLLQNRIKMLRIDSVSHHVMQKRHTGPEVRMVLLHVID
jgi:hypothetical protein